MVRERDRVLETVSEPDMIQAGDFGERLASRRWPRTALTRKFMVVAYREVDPTDGFILNGVPDEPAVEVEASCMDTVKILEKPTSVNWDYDEEADVLYLSLGEPRPAIGVDIGDGVILRYDEAAREVVGLTLIGLRARLVRELSESA